MKNNPVKDELESLQKEIARRIAGEEKKRDEAILEHRYSAAADFEMIAVGLMIAEKIVKERILYIDKPLIKKDRKERNQLSS